MKFLLVTVSVIAVFTAECQAFRNEPREDRLIPDEGKEQVEIQGGQNRPDGRDISLPATQLGENQTSFEDQLLSGESEGQGEAEDLENLLARDGSLIPATQLGENQTSSEGSDPVTEDQQMKIDDMDTLVGRSKWCKSRGGRCGRPNKLTCPGRYRESPKGRPYCTSKNRRCCYPATKAKCPEDEGFFKVPGSVNQCFKYFTESSRSWHEAQSKCQNESLVLAKPQDPLVLRQYLVETFGNGEAWIGARGTGSSVDWVRDGSKIKRSSSLWWSGATPRDTTSSYCLLLLGFESEMKLKPSKAYYMFPCSSSSWYALCELVM